MYFKELLLLFHGLVNTEKVQKIKVSYYNFCSIRKKYLFKRKLDIFFKKH